MRVLILGDAGTRTRTGGGQTWNLGLLRSLRAAGHEARCLSPMRRGETDRGWDEPGLTYVPILATTRRPPMLDDYRYALASAAALSWAASRASWQPDVIHLDGPRPELLLLGSRAFRQAALSGTFHGALAGQASPYQRMGALWMRGLVRLERAALRRMHAPMFNSPGTRRALAAAHGEQATAHGTVSWLGVDDALFDIQIAPGGPFHERWGGDPRIVSVGNFNRKKRLELVLELARASRERLPQARFVIVGRDEDPAYGRELRSQAAAMGLAERVVFAGEFPAPDMPQVYAAADLVFHPSAGETFCLAVAEAMAAGRPVVARAGLAMDDYLENGIHGVLAADDEGLVHAALDLLDSSELRASAGAAARGHARELFSWAAVVRRVEAAYRMALCRKHGESSPAGTFPAPEPASLPQHARSWSVVIPTYNEARDLEPCLKALAGQTLAPAQVVVVDADSTDGTPARAESFAGRLPLELIREPQRRGVSAARNTGLAAATGERTMFLNADVVLPADFLARVAAHHAAGADAVVVTSPVLNRDALIPDYLGAWAHLSYRDTPAFWSEGYTVRTELARRVGGFLPFPAASAGEDLAFGEAVARAGRRVEDRTIEAPNRVDEDWGTFWRLRRERGKGAAVYARLVQGRNPWLELIRSLAPPMALAAAAFLLLPTAWAAGLLATGIAIRFLGRACVLARYAHRPRILGFALADLVHWLAHKLGYVQGCGIGPRANPGAGL